MMMKKSLITVMVLFLFFSVKAQLPIDKKTGLVCYSEVVDMNGMTKSEVFDKAKMWIVSTLKSGDNMVELSGDNTDKIVGTGNLATLKVPELDLLRTKNLFISDSYINFKFIVHCKEGRLKYKITNIDFTSFAGNGKKMTHTGMESIDCSYYGKKNGQRFEKYVKGVVDATVKTLAANFVKGMNAQDDSEDW